MGPRGNLRDHAAERLVRLVLVHHRRARILRSLVTSAAALSSQLLSRPRMIVMRGRLCPKLPRCTRGGACRDSSWERADRRWRWRRRARSRPRSRPRSAGPTAISRSSSSRRGDKVQDRLLAEVGGKALWTKELDEALLSGKVDFCVHSMKDVESVRPKEIHIAAVRPRGDVRDRLIGAESIDKLKRGAVVGTSSPRRAAQMLSIRPDLKIVPIRGNVETRLAKVSSGEVDATLLASAGLKRLGIDAGTAISTEVMLPASRPAP